MNETFKMENLWLNPNLYFSAILLFNNQMGMRLEIMSLGDVFA